jgi:catechol 2,3-dioxygenase-like lactoylglutathione lyase family enzyme
MKAKISLVTLGVADLGRALRFYRDGLGLPVHMETPEVVFFALEGTWLALYGREDMAADAGIAPEGAGFAGITLAHNVPSRDDVDVVLRTAEMAGGRLVKPGGDTDWGGYIGYFADPDGHLWEVAWNPGMDLT